VISGGTIECNGTAMEVNGSNVVISGGTLRGSFGIWAQESSNINISGGTVSGSSIGVFLQSGSSLSATTGSAIHGGDRAFRAEGPCTLDINGADVYNGSSFGVLDYAVMAAKNGDTVKLDKDFITSDNYLVFNALGKEVTVDGSYDGGKYEISGDYNILIISGPGEITLTNIKVACRVVVVDGAELVIGEGAEMNPTYDNTIMVQGGSKLTISAGAVEASGQYCSAISAEGSSQVLIEGGLVSQTHDDGAHAACIYIGDDSKLMVSGGIITAGGISGYGIETGDGAEVEINGGIVSGNTGIEVSGCYSGHSASFSVPATLRVTGGFVKGNTAVNATSYTNTPGSGSTVTIAGGTINGTRSAIAYEDGCTISVDEAATVETGVYLEVTGGAISPTAGEENNITLTIMSPAGVTLNADYSEHIIVSGYSTAPDGSVGSFNGVALTGTSIAVGLEFTDGVASVPLILNNAEQQDMSFHILGEEEPYNAKITITPVPAEAAFLAITEQPQGPALNGGLLTAQPVVKIADNFRNTVTSYSSTTITAAINDSGDWTLGGNVTAAAVSGIATFAGLIATNNSAATITTAALDFSAASLTGTYSTAFTVPVYYTVTFDKNGGTGGSGGTPAGASTIGTSGNTTTATTETKAITDSNGKAITSVTKDQLGSAVNSAVAEAKKQGDGTAAVVEIKVAASANTNSVETSIPKDAIGLAANGGADALKISTPVASISFDSDALDRIYGEAAGDVKITAAKVDASTLTDDAKELVGDRPVYNFSVTSGNDTISEFGGNVTVSVPYAPKEGEDLDAIVIYYINAEGNLETVSNCHYDPATGKVTFATDHFSKYVVGYNKVSFTDVKTGAWYENAVDFAAARGIVTGTGNGNFHPDGKLTRGQLLVMLMRAYSIAPDTDPSDNFSDAGNTYYTGYLAAAKKLGISEGLGNNLYEPEKQITRQEMFTLLYNTLTQINMLPEGTTGKTLTLYSDSSKIASWAKNAMSLFVGTGTVCGSSGKLNPSGTTSRAEMAQVLYNLLEK